MPSDWGLKIILFALPYIILSTFIIRLSKNIPLWHQVLTEIDMSWAIILFAWSMLVVGVIMIGVGITIMILKDQDAKKIEDEKSIEEKANESEYKPVTNDKNKDV